MLFVNNFKFYLDLEFEKINAHFNVMHFTNIYISIYVMQPQTLGNLKSTTSPKVKIMKGEGVAVHSLVCNTLGVEGRARALGQGLGRMTSKSIIHTDLHKPNNKLVSSQLEHFLCTNEPQANIDSQGSTWLGLEGIHHLPPYSILCAQRRDQHLNVILSQDSQVRIPKFSKLGLS